MKYSFNFEFQCVVCTEYTILAPQKRYLNTLLSDFKYSETELVAMLQGKSEQAFSELYDAFSPALFGIILKIVKTEEPAQDVLQDSFVKIWRYAEKYDNKKGRIFTWMLNIARNTAIDYLRSKHVKYSIQMTDAIVSVAEQDSVQQNHDFIGVGKVIKTLKPEHQAVLDALYFGGYTHEEASKELNIPLGTLKTRARAAIKTLKQLLNN